MEAKEKNKIKNISGLDLSQSKLSELSEGIEFPLPISDNVKRFFYPEFMFLNPNGIIEYDQFCDILNGNDKSENAYLVLNRLLDSRYNRLPPKSFDILEDNVEEDIAIDYHSSERYVRGEKHKGICTLDGFIFDFEYYLNFHNTILIKKDGEIIGHKTFRRPSTVKLHGDTKEYTDVYMHKACQKFLLYKSYNFDEKLILEKVAEEKDKWRKAVNEHKLELIDYLKSQSWSCNKMDWRIEKGIISYEQFRYLEKGCCRLYPICHASCFVKKGRMNEYGEHDDFWFKIGLDKLDLKFLD